MSIQKLLSKRTKIIKRKETTGNQNDGIGGKSESEIAGLFSPPLKHSNKRERPRRETSLETKGNRVL